MTAHLVLLVFLFFMTLAAVSDVMGYVIPNWISAALALAFPVAAAAVGLGWIATGMHLLMGVGALAFGMALWAPGLIGGGDAKLFAAGALWFGWPGAASFMLATVFAGGVFILLLLLLRRLAPVSPLPAGWIGKTPLAAGAPVPYGVALACGAMWALPANPFFAFV
jgi:prepilin peptidase CpaA